MEEFPFVAVSENLERKMKGIVQLFVKLINKKVGQAFMFYARQQYIFQSVGERSVSDIMKQDRDLHRFVFFIGNFYAF